MLHRQNRREITTTAFKVEGSMLIYLLIYLRSLTSTPVTAPDRFPPALCVASIIIILNLSPNVLNQALTLIYGQFELFVAAC